ncbi:MAG: hypothetical protein AB3N20_12385 [Rhizobiaceae bacterium]
MSVGQDRKPPRAVRFPSLQFAPRFEYGDVAEVAVVTGSKAEGELGSGFVRMQNAEIPWTVQYDEVLLVVEGEIAVQTEQGDLVAGPKDCIWLSRGTRLVYKAEDALLFYAIHPWNWAETST